MRGRCVWHFFWVGKKPCFFTFFPSNLGTPAHSCKVFATRPPERIGFGNNAKRCMGTMFGIFCRWEKKLVFSFFLWNFHYLWGPQQLLARSSQHLHLRALDLATKAISVYGHLPLTYFSGWSNSPVLRIVPLTTLHPDTSSQAWAARSPQSRGGATRASSCLFFRGIWFLWCFMRSNQHIPRKVLMHKLWNVM